MFELSETWDVPVVATAVVVKPVVVSAAVVPVEGPVWVAW